MLLGIVRRGVCAPGRNHPDEGRAHAPKQRRKTFVLPDVSICAVVPTLARTKVEQVRRVRAYRRMIPVSTRWYSSRRVPAKALAEFGGAATFEGAEENVCAAELLLFGGTVKRFDCSLVFTTSNGAVTMPPARPPRLHICDVS